MWSDRRVSSLEIMAHFHREAARLRVLDDVKHALTQDSSDATGPIVVRHKAPSLDAARELVSSLTGPMGGLRSLPGIDGARLPCSVRLVDGEGIVVEVVVSPQPVRIGIAAEARSRLADPE